MARSLLERLRPRASAAVIGHSAERDAHELRESVCANLERILNSRAGMAACCEKYGLPDFAQLIHSVLPQRSRELEDSIAACIREFEPRVSDIKVEFFYDRDRPLTAFFQIRASVRSGAGLEEIWFKTVVERSGRLKLNS